MAELTTDQARQLLGGSAGLNGQGLLAGRANRDGVTLVTVPPRSWSWRRRDPGERRLGEARPGSRLIASGTVLLFAAMAGLLGVSYAAQYSYILGQRHQHVASLIEAGALDVLLIIFSLLALGLARAGLPAKTERALVLVFACGSALMNYAAADIASPRSVAAYVMPPVALAIVVDRCVAVTRRHVLGMRDGRSPWAVVGAAAGRVLRFAGLSGLYVFRFLADRKGTCAGIRAAILNATPLPQLKAPQDGRQDEDEKPNRERRERKPPDRRHERAGRGGTKTTRFLRLVTERHGDLAAIPLDQVARIATALAPEADLHPASARTALLGAVRAALPAGKGDAR
jgi:hypothetical protein